MRAHSNNRRIFGGASVRRFDLYQSGSNPLCSKPPPLRQPYARRTRRSSPSLSDIVLRCVDILARWSHMERGSR
jgi:hypothetical protein